jgi:hypothetical protein
MWVKSADSIRRQTCGVVGVRTVIQFMFGEIAYPRSDQDPIIPP